MLAQSLWLRRTAAHRNDDLRILFGLSQGTLRWPYEDELFTSDIELLARWISGASYVELSEAAPSFNHASSLFGGLNPAKRASDAAEYVGRLAYPAGWAWSAARVLMGDLGEELPPFLRHAVELGAPSESACALLFRGGVARPTALEVAEMWGPEWSVCARRLSEIDVDTAMEVSATEADSARLIRLAEKLSPDL